MDLSSVQLQAPKPSQRITHATGERLAQLFTELLPLLDAKMLGLFADKEPVCVVGEAREAANLNAEFSVKGQRFALSALSDNAQSEATQHVFAVCQQSLEVILALDALLGSQQQQQLTYIAHTQALWHGSNEALLHITEQGAILSGNEKAQMLLGFTGERLQQLNIDEILPKEWRHQREKIVSHASTAEQPIPILGWRCTLTATRADGVHIPVVVNVRQLVWPNQQASEYTLFIRTLRSTQSADTQISERVLLQTIIDASPNPIFARDKFGNYLIANEASKRFIHPVVAGATAGGPHQQRYREAVAVSERAHRKVLTTGQIETLELHTPEGDRYTVSKSPILGKDNSIDGVVSVAHNITEFWQATVLLEKQRHLLSVLHKGLTDYGAMLSGNQLWRFLKRALKDLTGSEYALLGEVENNDHRPKLKIHAISDLSWSDESRQLMQQLSSGEMLIDSPDSLLGQAYVHGQVVLNNDVAATPTHFPLGHPALKNYLAVPITDGDTILGMYAIANSDEPYSQGLVEWLEPYTSTCALLIKLQRQIHEQALTNEALIRAHQEAERASQAKTEFLSSMSHELRTPLNAIMGFAQLLVGRTEQDVRTRRQAEHILKSGKHLLELINEILDLARIESGHLALSIEKIHLVDVLQSCVENLRGMAKRHEVQLDIDASGARNVWVLADFTRLRQVLDNLLSNAIKYNRPNGVARVRISQDPERIKVEVIDTGIGIAHDKYPLIFTPFNRLGAENGAIEGTGVGLALTKKIIEHMQGEIGFSSQENQGSTFWFSLPASDPAQAQVSSSYQWKPEDIVVAEHAYKVLYIEDNPANLRLMQDIFEELEGFELLSARDGLKGLEAAQTLSPELILLDINLPGLNGYQLLTLLRSDPKTAHIPVVGLSANAMSRDIQAALAAGFDQYLTKPLDLSGLFTLLEDFKNNTQQARDQRPQ